MLASALDKLTFRIINYIRNPEIWISACIWYTPDFIIGKRLIIEVDGGIHGFEYRQTPDRIRQRALENMDIVFIESKMNKSKFRPRM